jgi:hypothetical protein
MGMLCGPTAAATAAAAAGPPAATATARATATATAKGTAASMPRPDHVVVVMFENTSASSIVGNPNAPYFNQLASSGANFTQSYAIQHPSQPNYLDLFSGSNQGVNDDSCPHTFSTDNEAAQLIAKGLTFTGYSEDLPSAGSTSCSSGNYARKHVPWVNFTNVPAADNQPFTSFPSDYSQLPTVSWVIPNLCDDMHNCSIGTGDTWLKNNLDSYVQWAKTHNSLLITTFDEDDSSSSANRIATFFNGTPVKAGTYSEHIDHFSVLRTIEDMYGLPYAGAAAQATSITDVWNTGGTGGVSVTDPGAQSGTVGTAASLQLQAADTAGGTLGWTATGLPPGLSISASTGKITGTPTTAGTYSVTATATDSTGPSGQATFSWTVNAGTGGGCTSAQLLNNPGFESGNTAWSSTSGVVGQWGSQGEPTHSGTWNAWLNGLGSPHTDTLSQSLTIPASCTSATLSYYLHIDTAETTTSVAYDSLTLQAGTTTLATYSNLNHNSGYSPKSLNLSPYIGKTVTLKFTGTEDDSLQTSFVIDDAAVNVS